MFWIMLLLLAGPQASQAETSARIPEVVKDKWDEVYASVSDKYGEVQKKIEQARQSETSIELRKKALTVHQSSLVQFAAGAMLRFWEQAKSKGKGALLRADAKLHEKLLGERLLQSSRDDLRH